MNDKLNIDELLNGFIDGQLTPRQLTEMQRLITHDVEIVERLHQLQRCKMLLSSLPSAEAPAELAAEIKATLESKTLLADPTETQTQRHGTTHLLLRHIVTAAAMIALAAVLGGVIYSIVAPAGKPHNSAPVALNNLPDVKIEPAKVPPVAMTKVDHATLQPIPATGFNARLELTTDNIATVDALIKKAVASARLEEKFTATSQAEKNIYNFTCGARDLERVLANLQNTWKDFSDATLFVTNSPGEKPIVIDSITPVQIAQIGNQTTADKRFELVKSFIAANSLQHTPARGIEPALLPIPKPVLTSPERPSENIKENIRLTIVIAAHK